MAEQWFQRNILVFVVNTGNATAKDVCMLTDMVKDKVKQQSGVDLELEVIKLGDFS